MSIRVAVIEDHPLMLKAVVRELEGQNDIKVVGTATHGAELQRLVRETEPNVVVLDLGMTNGSFEPTTAVKTLRETHPEVHVLILTGYDDATWVRELIAVGAQGYVLKSDDLSLCLPQGVRRIYEGGRFYSPTATEKYFSSKDNDLFSDQDLALLNLVAQGLSNTRIAQEMNISEKTVRNYLVDIYRKLGVDASADVNSRVTAVNKARELSLLHKKE